jgi:hypothetical protein
MGQLTPLKQTPVTIIRRPGQLIIPKRQPKASGPTPPPVDPPPSAEPVQVGGTLAFTQGTHPSGIYQWKFSPDGVAPYLISNNPNLQAAYPLWAGAISGGTVGQNTNILDVVIEMNGMHMLCEYDGGAQISEPVICVVTP